MQGLVTRRDVARLLGIPLRTLTWVLYGRGTSSYYKTWTIKKKSGGTREVHAPRSTLYRLQGRLNALLQDVYDPKPAAQGFVRGRSVATNARPHVRRRFVFNLDLENFFPTIHFGRVRGLFLKEPFQCSPEVATALAQLCCCDGALPIGAPTSPVIANMICLRLDGELQRLARRRGCWYSRYADDLTFSTNRSTFPQSLARIDEDGNVVVGDELSGVLDANGFSPNAAKTRLQGRGNRQIVTGVLVNEKLNVDRRYVRRIRAMIHAWDRYGLPAAQDYFDQWDSKDRHPAADPSFRDVLFGRISYLMMIRGHQDPMSRRFARQFENLDNGRELNLGIDPTTSDQPQNLPSSSERTRPEGLSTDVSTSSTEERTALIESWDQRPGTVADRVRHAIGQFRLPNATEHDLRSAVITLAGVLEERRSTVKRMLPRRDEAALFEIANRFGIRHRRSDQLSDYDARFLTWIFWWYLATIDLCEQLIASRRQSDSE